MMYRLEARQAAAAARSAAEAKAEALRGLDLKTLRVQGDPKIGFQIFRRRRDAETSDSEDSFDDSARGDAAV
jgi:hypothetical protein